MQILYDRHPVLLVGNFILSIAWIIFDVLLFKYDNYLNTLVLPEDGWFVRAFKLVFSDEVSNMGWMLFFAVILIVLLICFVYKIFDCAYDEDQVYYVIFGILFVVDVIGILFTFFTILAPILISFILVGLSGAGAVFVFDNQ